MHGYQVSCSSPENRKAYGWQRDGGHAQYLLAEEQDCIPLPDTLSYVDGAFLACGFGTVWECLTRMQLSGRDRLLVTGLGPVGLAAAQLGRLLGASEVIGLDIAEGRLELARGLEYRPGVPLVDHVLSSAEDARDDPLDAVLNRSEGAGCEASIDCSGASAARELALKGTRAWGRCGFVGEGGTVQFDVSPYLIHKQITLYGSWVTSRGHMAELARVLARHGVHPEATAGPKLPLSEASRAYELADSGQSGKISIVFE
jgi:threonine dehydrogenase-like Zn-dependent dehydrogenase